MDASSRIAEVARCGLVVGVACGALSGCWPVAVPPMQLTAGGGVALRREQVGLGRFHGRVGVAPMGAFPGLVERPVDVSAGWILDLGDGKDLVHGPYLQLDGFFPLRRATTGQPGTRLFGRLQGRYLLDVVMDRWSPGFALGFGVELFKFSSGPTHSTDSRGAFVGTVSGEVSVAPFIEVGYGELGGMAAWSLISGLSVRWPAVAGIAIGIPSRR